MLASWLTATHGVRAAERAIDALEADPVLAQHSSCTDAALYAGRCSDSTYDREQALEQARARLAAFEEQLAAVEEAARVAGVPMVCLVDPLE